MLFIHPAIVVMDKNIINLELNYSFGNILTGVHLNILNHRHVKRKTKSTYETNELKGYRKTRSSDTKRKP